MMSSSPGRHWLFPAIAALLLLPAPTGAQEARWVPGITEAVQDIILSAPAAGVIARQPVSEGDLVQPGDLLVELDRELEQLEMNRREAILDVRKAGLESSMKDFETNTPLSREELEEKITEHALANVEFELAKKRLHRRRVIAPFQGTVAALFLDPGEACHPRQALARLVDTRKCHLVCHVESRAGYLLRPGQTVNLEIEAGEKPATFIGTISFVSPVVDPASGLLTVKVLFDNPERKIRPGVAGKMQLPEQVDG